ncbi:MAG: hypothetical protein IT237_07320 [Bacteroidia bacterium]|nr:hypothetical protein [Bacteroidia bacterium]
MLKLKLTNVSFIRFFSKNKKLKVFLLLALPLLAILSCNTTEPTDEIKPGSRNYEWTLDTLKLKNGDFLTLTRMWANSSNDVWTIGFGDVSRNLIWHFDGNRWSTDSIPRGMSPTGIFGFGSNNVWLGTAEGAFWHYNGSTWSEISKHSITGYDRVVIENIWGSASNNIYAVGFAENYVTSEYKAILMKYNGLKWDFVQIPDLQLSFTNIRQQQSTGLFIISAYNLAGTNNNNRLIIYKGADFTEINAGNSSTTIYDMNGEVYITMGRKIYKYLNNQLTLWKDLSSNFFGYGIYGKTEKDFFSFADAGISYSKDMVGHYNGTDFKILLETNLHYTGAGAYVDNNIFVTAFDDSSNSSVIIHGKIKE